MAVLRLSSINVGDNTSIMPSISLSAILHCKKNCYQLSCHRVIWLSLFTPCRPGNRPSAILLQLFPRYGVFLTAAATKHNQDNQAGFTAHSLKSVVMELISSFQDVSISSRRSSSKTSAEVKILDTRKILLPKELPSKPPETA